MNVIVRKKHEEDNISIYEELAPGKGDLLYALVEDFVEIFKKHYKPKYKNDYICEKSIYDLMIESNSFSCYLFFKNKERKIFKSKSIHSKKEIIKRLYLSQKVTIEEKEFFIKEFMKTRFNKNELKELYITSLIYAAENIFCEYFKKYRKHLNNKEIGYIIKIFENNDILSLKEYKNNKHRIELVYKEILSLGRKRNVFWKHYVNATYLGNETEVLRRDFFYFLPHNEKMKWIQFLFANNNLVYYSTSLYEEIKEKFAKKDIPMLEKNLNLDFIFFIIEDILPYLKSNNIQLSKVQIKKLILFRETLSEIMKNIFLFESILNLNNLDSSIHEWTLMQKIKKSDKKNDLLKSFDRKKQKI